MTGLVMPAGDELILSSSPHIHDRLNVQKIMLKVILTLVPALAAGVWFFGMEALRVVVITTVACVAAEAIWFLIGKSSFNPLRDCSAILTGVLLAMNLPASAPWWVCVLGGFIAIWVGKQVFGGIGHNIFNPALVARVALLIALPAMMTTWTPTEMMKREWQDAQVNTTHATPASAESFVSCATPLGIAANLKAKLPCGANTYDSITTKNDYKNYFIGNRAGSLGETSCMALLLGGIALMFMKLIKWQIPIFFIATVALFTAVIHAFAPELTPPAAFHVLNGGLLLGAFFMATDMVTSPMTNWGGVVFAVGCGVITVVIRVWGSYPEGVSFSILLMNALVPLIDRMCHTLPFGYVRKKVQVSK